MANKTIKKLLITRDEEGLRAQVHKELLRHLKDITGEEPKISGSKCTIHSHDFLCVQTVQDRRSIKDGNEINYSRQYSIRTVGKGDVDRWAYTRSDLSVTNHGAEKTFRVDGSTHTIQCLRCSGSGQVPCTRCSSSGTIPCSNCNASGRVRCNSCGGRGRKECFWCNGKGYKESGYGESKRIEKCSSCNGGTNPCSSCNQSGQVICGTCDGRTRLTCPRCDGRTTVDCSSCNACGSHNDYLYVHSKLDVAEKKKFLAARPSREVTNWSFEKDELLKKDDRSSLSSHFSAPHFKIIEGFFDKLTKTGTAHRTVRWRSIKATQHDYDFEFILNGDTFELDVDTEGNWTLPDLVADRLVAEASSRLKFDPKLKRILGMRKLMLEQVPDLEENYKQAKAYVGLSNLMDRYEAAEDTDKDDMIDVFASHNGWQLTEFRAAVGALFVHQRLLRLRIFGFLSVLLGLGVILFVNVLLGLALLLLSLLPRRQRMASLVGQHFNRAKGHRSFAFNYVVWPVLLVFSGLFFNHVLDKQVWTETRYDGYTGNRFGKDYVDGGLVMYGRALTSGAGLSDLFQPQPELRKWMDQVDTGSDYDRWKQTADIVATPRRDWHPAATTDSIVIVKRTEYFQPSYAIPKGTRFQSHERYERTDNGWTGIGEFGPRLANQDIVLTLTTEELESHQKGPGWETITVLDEDYGIPYEVETNRIVEGSPRHRQLFQFIPLSKEAYVQYQLYGRYWERYEVPAVLDGLQESISLPAVVEIEGLGADYFSGLLTERIDRIEAENAELEDLQPDRVQRVTLGTDVTGIPFTGQRLFDGKMEGWVPAPTSDPDGFGTGLDFQWNQPVLLHTMYLTNAPWGPDYEAALKISEVRLVYEEAGVSGTARAQRMSNLTQVEMGFSRYEFDPPLRMNHAQIRITVVADPELGRIDQDVILDPGSPVGMGDLSMGGGLNMPEVRLYGERLERRVTPKEDESVSEEPEVETTTRSSDRDEGEIRTPFWSQVRQGVTNVNVRSSAPDGNIIRQIDGGEALYVTEVVNVAKPVYLLSADWQLKKVNGVGTITKPKNTQILNAVVKDKVIEGDVLNNRGKEVRIRVSKLKVNEIPGNEQNWYYVPELKGYVFSGLMEPM